MHVLVTGGGGYLGCHLVPHLLERGHHVRVFDRFCFGEEPARSVYGDAPHCEIVRGDIRRLHAHPGLLEGIEGIIHLAGLANDPSCDLDEEMALDVNLRGSKDLAQRAIEQGVRRFVYASSCSVYGKGVFELLDEESPTSPVSVYGLSKLETEHALLPLKSPSFEPVAARPATLFGWSPRMRFDLAINQMVASASRKGRVTVFGGGNQWRPFVHVRDAAHAFALLLEAPAEKVSGEVFNVGFDDVNFRIRDLAALIVAHFDNVELEVARDDADVRSYNVQFGKIRNVLGFEHGRTVEEAIAEIRQALEDPAIDPSAEVHFNVRRMQKLLGTPVTQGGEPVAPHFISLARPALDREEAAILQEIVLSEPVAPGDRVADFEQAFAERVSAPHAVAVSSCAAAVHLAVLGAGVGPGDEVILPAITRASTANTLVHMGAKPVFADVCPDTLTIDPAAIEAALTEKTKALVPLHLGGQPCDLDVIYHLADKHNVSVVEDAAHALGASYRGNPIGSGGACVCFSCPGFPVSPFENGVLTVQSEELAARSRALAHNGMPHPVDAMPAEVTEPGYSYRMDDLSAAIALEHLRKLDATLAARRRLAKLYRTVLGEIDEIYLLDTPEDTEHAWRLMIIRLKLDKLTKSRDEIARALRDENIGTGVHFYGLHLHHYYRRAYGLRPEALPQATAASQDILSLPLHPRMSDKHVHHVVEALKKVLAHSRSKA